MGYRLEGPQIEQRTSADIVSDGIPLGAIQVPGDGLPIILLGDRQTTGGYTKIAVVSSVDIPKVAQAKPGDAIRFKAIPLSEARHELLDYEQRIHALKHALDAS
jgi:allophanate hydrolase subunit 2